MSEQEATQVEEPEVTATEEPGFEYEDINPDEFNIDALTNENFSTTSKEQPPQAGEETLESDESEATDEEEDGEGSETPNQSDDQETTAETDESGDKSDEEKAPTDTESKWSEESQKYFENKGLKDIPFSESTETLVKIAQDGEKRNTEVSQNLSNAQAANIQFARAFQSGDVKFLQQMAQEMGGDLQIDTRTHEDRINEIKSSSDEVYNAFSPVRDTISALIQNNPDAQESLVQVWNDLKSRIEGFDASKTESIKELQQSQRIRDEIAKATGNNGKATSPYAQWSANAENAFTELRKLDPKADEYIDALKSEVGEGTAFEAAGINIAKLFGGGPAIYRTSYKIGKALALLNQQESGELQKSFYEKFQKENKKRIGGGQRGNGGSQLLQEPRVNSSIDHDKWARDSGLFNE